LVTSRALTVQEESGLKAPRGDAPGFADGIVSQVKRSLMRDTSPED